MSTNLYLRVITHNAQRLVHRVLTHRFTMVVIANENKIALATKFVYLFKDC